MNKQFIDFPLSARESLVEIEEKTSRLIEDKAFKLRFTSSLNTKGALGSEAAMLQLLGTWVQKNNHTKIFHSYQGNRPEDFRKLCFSIYGIAVLSMADEVWDAEKNQLPRGLVLDEAKTTIQSLRQGNFSSCFKSRYFGVPYIKTLRYDKEFDMPFYNGTNVIEVGAFNRIIEKILTNEIAGKSRFNNLQKMIGIQDISGLLWELLKNTHDHGRSNEKGDLLPRNFRALIIQQPDLNPKYFETWCGKNPSKAQQSFSNYWVNKKQGKIQFLDLSIVDFGSGFVDLAKEMSGLDDDAEIFLKCLEKGWSRLTEKSRGGGLTKVLNVVHEYKGWLRIRTSNILLEKTFVEETSSEILKEDIQILKEDIQIMPTVVAGTSIHISLPLEGFKEEDI